MGQNRAFAFYDLFHRRGKHVFTALFGRILRFLLFWSRLQPNLGLSRVEIAKRARRWFRARRTTQ